MKFDEHVSMQNPSQKLDAQARVSNLINVEQFRKIMRAIIAS